MRSTPLIPCRRHGKKRKEDELPNNEGETNSQGSNSNSNNTAMTAQPNAGSPGATAPTTTQTTASTNNNSNNKKETSAGGKSKSKAKAAQSNATAAATTPALSAPPTTPSPRCQTPVTNNPSPAGSAFSTPPVNNNMQAPGNATPNQQLMASNSSLMNMATMIDTFTDAQLQSNQISSTVLDSPYSYDYQTGSYIDSRNYYGNWPPPPPHAVPNMPAAGGAAAVPATTQHGTPAQHHATAHNAPLAAHPQDNSNGPVYGSSTPVYNNLTPTAGSQQLTQVHDVRLDVKSRGGSEENPDSTTLVNNGAGLQSMTSNPAALPESKLTTLTPMTPMAHHTAGHEEGFVKPKAPAADYQYSQYPNNYQMYPPPHSAYSAYDAYQNMNYNYGYHQAYTPYGMYPQQTPPPTPPPPSPNWNMYGHHQSTATTATPVGSYAPTALPPSGAVNADTGSLIQPQTNNNQISAAEKPIETPTAPTSPPSNRAVNATPPATVNAAVNDSAASNNQTDLNAEANMPTANNATPLNISSINEENTENTNTSTASNTGNDASPAAADNSPVATPNPSSAVASTADANKIEPIGEVAEINENYEAFQDPQMGGVAIALQHGSVLIECAKHEMHATTAVRNPNRHQPTRMTLIFYQHRNLNRTRHGIDEWEEKMRVKKINTDLDNKAKEEKEKIKKEPKDKDVFEARGEEDEEMLGAAAMAAASTTTMVPEKKPAETKAGGKKKKESAKKNANNQHQNNNSNNNASNANSNTSSLINIKHKPEMIPQPAPLINPAPAPIPAIPPNNAWNPYPMHPCGIPGVPYHDGTSPSSTQVPQQLQQQQQHAPPQVQAHQQLPPLGPHQQQHQLPA